MKRSSYVEVVNEVKRVIQAMDVDVYNTVYIMTYLSGYMPDAPIGACMDAIIQLRDEQVR